MIVILQLHCPRLENRFLILHLLYFITEKYLIFQMIIK
jgi:hypothetical protein